MNAGSIKSLLQPREIMDRLTQVMAAGNFEILSKDSDEIQFRHGTMLTNSAPMLPKRGVIRLLPYADATLVRYEIEVTGFAKYWLIFIAVIFCWAIFPPIIVHRALTHHPKALMENLLHCL